VFDELIDYPVYKEHEIKALHEFLLASPHVAAAVVGKDGRPPDGPALRFYMVRPRGTGQHGDGVSALMPVCVWYSMI
jgi:hypothetical protein